MTDEMKKAIIAEISEYCKDKDEDWDLTREKALRNWGRKEPVPQNMSDTIDDAAREWFWDNFNETDFIPEN